MAGFETIVRPVVFPNIRPNTPRVLPSTSEPTQGLATIQGNPANQVSRSENFSASWSKQRNAEWERRVDIMRVYQKEAAQAGNEAAGTTVNKENYVDIEVTNRLRKRGSPTWTNYYRRLPEADNIELIEKDVIRKNSEVPKP